MQDVKRPQVGILTKSLKTGSELGKIFRKLNIVPDCFDSVESFLIAQIEGGFDLCILDIEMCLYEGEPIVNRREMAGVKLAFFHSGETISQITPTFGMTHLGYINSDNELQGQVKNILLRYNNISDINRELTYYKNFYNENKIKQEKLLLNNEALKERSYYKDLLSGLIKDIHINSQIGFFTDYIPEVLDSKDFILGYSYLELNELGNKLLPMNIDGKKKIQVPPLWLGRVNHGIEEASIAMAQNVVSSLVSSPVIILNLSHDSVKTSALLVLEVKPEVQYSIDWQVVESVLNGFYASSYVKKMGRITTIKSHSVFDLMSKLSTEYHQNLIAIDLSDIVDFTLVKKEAKFSWSLFWRDFKVYLSQIIQEREVYSVSMDTVAFTVDSEIFEETFAAANDLCAKFSLYKYFEGMEKFEVQGLKLKVKEVPFSEFGLINHVEAKSSPSMIQGPMSGEALL